MVEDWVKELTEEVCGPAPFMIGDIVGHPDGRIVRIVGGQYWGTHGLSNYWSWVPVDEKGEPCGERESGYGWKPNNIIRLEGGHCGVVH